MHYGSWEIVRVYLKIKTGSMMMSLLDMWCYRELIEDADRRHCVFSIALDNSGMK